MSRYSSRASSVSTASARTSPLSGADATGISTYGSGGVPKSCARPWRPSTSTRRVRRPPAASAMASAAATVVFPVPPLPVTTCSRAGQRSRKGTPRAYLRRSLLLDVADEPAVALDDRELELLARLLHVGRGERHGRGDHHVVLGRRLRGECAPRVLRGVVLLVLLLDLIDLGGKLLLVPGGGADQWRGLRGVLIDIDGLQEALRGRRRGTLADPVGAAVEQVDDGQPTAAEYHEHDDRDEQATTAGRRRCRRVERREPARWGAARIGDRTAAHRRL